MKIAVLFILFTITIGAKMTYNKREKVFYSTHGTTYITPYGYDLFVRLFSYIYWEQIGNGVEPQAAFDTSKKEIHRLIWTNSAGVRIFLSDLHHIKSWNELLLITA